MHASRFDTLARVLTTAGSRRRALAGLSSALGIFGLTDADDAAAGGKCKPKCDECETCKKGKHGKKGKCKPKPNSTACSGGTCQSGGCIAAPTPSPAPACSAEADFCVNSASTCGDGGFCFRPLGGGPSRCGFPSFSTCGGCTNHDQCSALFAGSFCAQDTGTFCLCDTGQGFCTVPR